MSSVFKTDVAMLLRRQVCSTHMHSRSRSVDRTTEASAAARSFSGRTNPYRISNIAVETCDVAVVGSGGAALAAALSAAEKGAEVVVLERGERLGGTTAVSGGLLWVPGNEFLPQASRGRDLEDALGYLRRLTRGDVRVDILWAYVDSAFRVVDRIQTMSPLRFGPMPTFPDYQPEVEGAVSGGRGLETLPFPAAQLGQFADKVSSSPFYTSLLLSELKGALYDPAAVPWDRAADRIRNNVRTLGSALVCGLLKGCLDLGVDVRLGLRARRLVMDDDRVAGVIASGVGGEITLRARCGVVLGSGGFDWSPSLQRELLGSDDFPSVGVPTNEGDGLVMARSVGARVVGTGEAWWEPVGRVGNEEWPLGQPLYRPNVAERSLPGSIMVDRHGVRFVNESMNYHELAHVMLRRDPETGDRPHRLAWTIFDSGFKDRYMVMTVMPGDPAPGWLRHADSLVELGEAIEVDGSGLAATVDRFNGFAARGIDPDFHRGDSAYDRYQSDPRRSPNPCLAPLGDPPFYALETPVGMVGTKAGLAIDDAGRVLDTGDRPIRGLFACGNLVAAAVTGTTIWGPGGTIGPALVFGYLAGRAAADAA